MPLDFHHGLLELERCGDIGCLGAPAPVTLLKFSVRPQQADSRSGVSTCSIGPAVAIRPDARRLHHRRERGAGHPDLSQETRMTHAVRFVAAVTVLTACRKTR
jgi:hypothetical protein